VFTTPRFMSSNVFAAWSGGELLWMEWHLHGHVTNSRDQIRFFFWQEGSGGGLIWMEWHPRGHVILAGAEDGCTFMWDISHSSSASGVQTYEVS